MSQRRRQLIMVDAFFDFKNTYNCRKFAQKANNLKIDSLQPIDFTAFHKIFTKN